MDSEAEKTLAMSLMLAKKMTLRDISEGYFCSRCKRHHHYSSGKGIRHVQYKEYEARFVERRAVKKKKAGPVVVIKQVWVRK